MDGIHQTQIRFGDGIHQTKSVSEVGFTKVNHFQRWDSPKSKLSRILMEFARIKSRFRDEIHQTPKHVQQLNLQKLKSSVGMRFTKPDLGWNSHSSSISSLSL
jgi:hypothetical protein